MRQIEKSAFQELSRPHRIKLMMEYNDDTFDKSFLCNFKSLLCQDVVNHISDDVLNFLESISIDELKFRYYGSNKAVPTNRLKNRLKSNGILTCKDLILYLQQHDIITEMRLSPLSYKILVYAICDLVYGKNADINLQDIFNERDKRMAQQIKLEKERYMKDLEQQKVERKQRLNNANFHPERVTLEDLDFDKSINLYLKREGINTLADLIKYCGIKKNITTIHLLGKTRENMIYQKLEQLGIDLDKKAIEYRNEQCLDPENMPIEILDLTLRVYNALKRKGVNTVIDLINFYFDNNNSLLSIGWLGPKGEAEILGRLNKMGIKLPTNQTLNKV